MEPYLILSIFAIVSSLLAAFIELVSIRHIDKRLEKEAGKMDEKGTIGEQFGDWLLQRDPDKPESPTNLEACASLVGRQIANSFSMGLKGIASGESRTIRGVEQKLIEGLETPETKALIALADQIGVDRSLAGTLLDILQRRGLSADQLIKNNGGGSQSTW